MKVPSPKLFLLGLLKEEFLEAFVARKFEREFGCDYLKVFPKFLIELTNYFTNYTVLLQFLISS